MKVLTRKRFTKQFAKLREYEKRAVEHALGRFRNNPLDPDLQNHPLKGTMQGKRSIAAGFDLRIIFEERNGYVLVIMLAVGSHEEVYGKP